MRARLASRKHLGTITGAWMRAGSMSRETTAIFILLGFIVIILLLMHHCHSLHSLTTRVITHVFALTTFKHTMKCMHATSSTTNNRRIHHMELFTVGII